MCGAQLLYGLAQFRFRTLYQMTFVQYAIVPILFMQILHIVSDYVVGDDEYIGARFMLLCAEKFAPQLLSFLH